MGIKDKLNTKFKNWGSKRSENSNVKDLEAEIEAETDRINHRIADIGEFYWNLYQKNAFVPEIESKEHFLAITNSLAKIDELKKEIEETRQNANNEREQNRVELEKKEKHDAELAAQRKKEKEKRDAEVAAEKKKQKEAQAELERMKKSREASEKKQ